MNVTEKEGNRGKIGWECCFYFPGSVIRMNMWLCCVRLVSLLCLYLYFTTTGLLKRLSKYIFPGTAWLITTKYKGNEQNAIRTNCSGRPRSLRSLRTSLWNCSHVPSASENGLQQSTVWTGWQDGLMLEEDTPKPNNNRFHPSNSHLLCRSGLEQRTLPPTCHSVCKFGVQCVVLRGECNKDEHIWEGSYRGWFALKQFCLCELNYWIKYSWQNDKREKWRQTILIQIIDDWSIVRRTGICVIYDTTSTCYILPELAFFSLFI